MEYVASGDVEAEGVHMLSTYGMLEHVEANPEGEFIVATETGMLYPLQRAAPQANLIEANRRIHLGLELEVAQRVADLRHRLSRGQARSAPLPRGVARVAAGKIAARANRSQGLTHRFLRLGSHIRCRVSGRRH